MWLSNDRVSSLCHHSYTVKFVIEGKTSLLNSDHQHLETASVCILLVEDFEPFRRLVSSLLERQVGFKIIGEAADGREGIQRAAESKPDLILLDLDLPLMDGIEVARQIRNCCPASTILFLSGNGDPDLVHAAFNAGGHGYVHKFDAVTDLVRGAKAVLSGKRFVSCRLKERGVNWDR